MDYQSRVINYLSRNSIKSPLSLSARRSPWTKTGVSNGRGLLMYMLTVMLQCTMHTSEILTTKSTSTCALPASRLSQPRSKRSRLIDPAIIEIAVEDGVKKEIAAQGIANLDKIEGNPDELSKIVRELSYLPGFDPLFKHMLQEASRTSVKEALRSAKGAYNELRSALVLMSKDYKILAFGDKEILGYKPDIITTYYFVECKNINWEIWLKNPRKYDGSVVSMLKQLKKAVEAGNEMNKKLIFMSKRTPPKGIIRKINNLGIKVIEG